MVMSVWLLKRSIDSQKKVLLFYFCCGCFRRCFLLEFLISACYFGNVSRKNFGKIKSGQSNLRKGRIAAAHGWYNGIQQVTLVCTPRNTCFLGPTRVHTTNCISISSTVFAGLTTVTDRQTHQATRSVTIAASS